ncbi:hypothetical protein ACF0H5_006257 [Mactra antiquata]
MIRLDQRNADIQGTERVFKKVVHGGHNALRFVDRNGLPLRAPNTATLSRLHSSYVLSPRGVPTRKSNHSYSGQLNQAKMQNMVSSLETSSQEMASYTSMHSYGNGLSSAGSGRHFLSTANSQKNRTFGPARSAKSMNKSASSQRTHNRLLVSAPGLEITNNDPNLETTNDSPQGKRLEKEWSALSQCRALKRSSEIVSHRVDRMYFMTGNKLKLQSKYHVEDDDLRHLRELQAARASSRASRSGRSKGDVYRPHSLKTDISNGDFDAGLVVSDEARRANRLRVENGHKENRDPKVIVSQKTLTPRPHSSNIKSPIQGWGGDAASDKCTTVANGIPNDETFHDNNDEDDNVDTHDDKDDLINDAINNDDNQGKDNNNDNTNNEVDNNESENKVVENGEKSENGKDNDDDDKVNVDIDDLVVVTGKNKVEVKHKDSDNVTKGNSDDVKSVQKTDGDTNDVPEDKDQTEVKSEDYLGK